MCHSSRLTQFKLQQCLGENAALGAVAVTMVAQHLRLVNVVTIAATQLLKAGQEWVEESLAGPRLQAQLNQQNKYNQADLTHRQSLDIFNED
jgi:hypothetical protein